jgi:diaminopimelate epimerase
MLNNFFKYQSLGNDFILFDWYKRASFYLESDLAAVGFTEQVQKICDRHYGVGADGVLVVKSNPTLGLPEMLVFNCDGTSAENCLNGLRCVAFHLYTTYNFPKNFVIKFGQREVTCTVVDEKKPGVEIQILTNVGSPSVGIEHSIKTSVGNFSGYTVEIGNPHFIVFQQVELAWLTQYGRVIEQHVSFPCKTNVEFVWQIDSTHFQVLVYERGCGITLACSSGAAAVAGLLAQLGKVEINQTFFITMLGGSVECTVEEDGNVILKASAAIAFRGDLS